MEKEMKIIPPEGYEIDKENSTFECIKFKPIKKDLTYKDVCDKIFPSTFFYIDGDSITFSANLKSARYYPNSAISKKQVKKVLAINQLMNIAKYYNGDWEPNYNDKDQLKFLIFYSFYTNKYLIESYYQNKYIGVVFKNKEDAQAVIDNPNFRDILDTIFK